jgi:hypothetical protein
MDVYKVKLEKAQAFDRDSDLLSNQLIGVLDIPSP